MLDVVKCRSVGTNTDIPKFANRKRTHININISGKTLTNKTSRHFYRNQNTTIVQSMLRIGNHKIFYNMR